jgi:hypothetical protein
MNASPAVVGWHPEGEMRVPIVFDNLIHHGEIPVTIGVFIDAGELRTGTLNTTHSDPGRAEEAAAGIPPSSDSHLNWDAAELNWFSANLRVAAALAERGYDLRLVLGDGGHNPNNGGAILPDALRWLWRRESE